MLKQAPWSRASTFALAALAWLMLWWWQPNGPDSAVPSLRYILGATRTYWQNGWLWLDLRTSLSRVAMGVLIALFAATLAAVLQVLFPRVARVLLLPLELLRSCPPIAIGPLAIGLLGVGGKPAVMIVAFGAFFPIHQSLRLGLQHIDHELVELARCFGASRYIQFMHVVFPTMLAHVMNGLYIGVGIGWFCVVAAEMLGADSGLGFRLQSLSMNLMTAGMWVYLITIGAAGWAMVHVARYLSNRLSPWRA
jgi:ABC-type nitrate/sulfonate/bicarbonate transport system permease component